MIRTILVISAILLAVYSEQIDSSSEVFVEKRQVKTQNLNRIEVTNTGFVDFMGFKCLSTIKIGLDLKIDSTFVCPEWNNNIGQGTSYKNSTEAVEKAIKDFLEKTENNTNEKNLSLLAKKRGFFSSAVNFIKDTFSKVVDTVKDAANVVLKPVQDIFKAAVSAVSQNFSGLVGKIVGSLINKYKQIPNPVVIIQPPSDCGKISQASIYSDKFGSCNAKSTLNCAASINFDCEFSCVDFPDILGKASDVNQTKCAENSVDDFQNKLLITVDTPVKAQNLINKANKKKSG